jgi:hypothetical protein
MNRPLSSVMRSLASGLNMLTASTRQHQELQPPDRLSTAQTDDVAAVQATACGSLTVTIPHATFAALRCYVEAVPGELTLLGTAHCDDEQIWIERLLLPEQSSSASHTEVSAVALAELVVEAVREGIDTARLQVWLHSHGQMQVFFSATDERNIQNAFPQADWVLSLVTNRAGQIKARLSLYKPFRLDVDNVLVKVGLPSQLESAIRKEVQRKVHHGYGCFSERAYLGGVHESEDNRGVGREAGASEAPPCIGQSELREGPDCSARVDAS